MKNNIVVFGGTFNPLTKAHGYILTSVGKKLNASKLILVPTNCSFLKSWKNFSSNQILSTKLRLEILEEFKKHNKNVDISKVEIENKSSKTYTTLKYIKQENPNSDIYFIMGSEKLDELSKWYKIDDLLKEFKIVIVKRNNDDISSLIKDNKYYNQYKDSFVFYSSKDEYQDISSTKIRELLNLNDYDNLNKYTYNYVVKILKRGIKYEI